MSKFVFYSDLHIRPERLEDCETVLKFVGEFAKKHDAIIVNGGDTFNTRGILRTHCFDVLYTHYKNWFDMGLKQVIVVGNHDQEDKQGEIHPMRVFSSFDGWFVVDEPTVAYNMGFCPYTQEPVEALGHLVGVKDICVHWGFRGAKRNAGNIDADGIEPKHVKKFRRVFSGHYHYRNEFENIHYIGSPMQQNFGERDQLKGVLLYDSKTQKISFHEIPKTRKHYDVEITIEDGKPKYGDIKSITENDVVRAKVVGDIESVSNITKEKILSKIKCSDVKVDREIVEKHFSRLNIKNEEIHTPLSLMNKYVDFIETDLSKKKLLEIGKELIA